MKIPPGYRDWTLISIGHEEGNLNDLRAQFGNYIAIKAFREGTLPFPDGAIIAAIHWDYVSSAENNRVFGRQQSFVAGPVKNIQFMVKDSKNTPRPAAGDLPTSRTESRPTRRHTRPALPATCPPYLAIMFTPITRRRVGEGLKHSVDLHSSRYLCRVATMGKKDEETSVRLSLQTLQVLEAFLENPTAQLAGAEVHQRCGIASGTLYPILIRLESAGWFVSQWEAIDPSALGRPRRRLYRLTFNRLEARQ